MVVLNHTPGVGKVVKGRVAPRWECFLPKIFLLEHFPPRTSPLAPKLLIRLRLPFFQPIYQRQWSLKDL
jgi:hypothetical protein